VAAPPGDKMNQPPELRHKPGSRDPRALVACGRRIWSSLVIDVLTDCLERLRLGDAKNASSVGKTLCFDRRLPGSMAAGTVAPRGFVWAENLRHEREPGPGPGVMAIIPSRRQESRLHAGLRPQAPLPSGRITSDGRGV
jgi:hypothetical protein